MRYNLYDKVKILPTKDMGEVVGIAFGLPEEKEQYLIRFPDGKDSWLDVNNLVFEGRGGLN